jgi:hypothetical protein
MKKCEGKNFYGFKKPQNQHKRRRKQMIYDPYSKDFKQGKNLTLQDIQNYQENEDKA